MGTDTTVYSLTRFTQTVVFDDNCRDNGDYSDECDVCDNVRVSENAFCDQSQNYEGGATDSLKSRPTLWLCVSLRTTRQRTPFYTVHLNK